MDSPLSHVLPEPGLTATLYRGIVPVSAGVQTLGGKLRIHSDASALFDLNTGFSGSVSASAIKSREITALYQTAITKEMAVSLGRASSGAITKSM